MVRSVSALSNAVVTLAVAPGILSHEWGHYLACRLLGLEAASLPTVFPLTGPVTFDHEPVDRFRDDVIVAVAPFLLNSVLGVLAFTLAQSVAAPTSWLFGWVGVTLGFTALPSEADTGTLVAGAETVSWTSRPFAYAVALPIRAATASIPVGGALAFLWTVVLFAVTIPV